MNSIVNTKVLIRMINGREYEFTFTGSPQEAENYISREIEMHGCYSTYWLGGQVSIYATGIECILYKAI